MLSFSISVKHQSIINEPICSTHSTADTISSARMEQILKYKMTRSSTVKNYHSIWKSFNNFKLRLDNKASNWENWVGLYVTFLVNKGTQSYTLKSYCSAIKKILKDDGYHLNMYKLLLNLISRACALVNDRIRIHLPIYCSLLEILLFELERYFNKQHYLEVLYKTILILGYYGLLRIGEVSHSPHSIKARDVKNKTK